MIYLKLEKEPETISELLTELFSHPYYCVSGFGCYKSVATYKDQDCLILDCPEDKYRSIDDTVEIVKTYFLEATEKEIFSILLNLTIQTDSKLLRFRGLNCYEIDKPTICFSEVVFKDDRFDTLDSDLLSESKYKNWQNVINIAGYHHEI